MSSSIDRASEIVTALISQEVRATTDPSAAVPPCILVPPPGRTFDLGCGFSARWELAAMAPAASAPDRNSWAVLDDLVAAAEAVLPLESAQLVSFNLAGSDYPAYLLAWSEAIA
jgi:hypothetical protein